MKQYQQLLIPSRGLDGTAPDVAAQLNDAATEGWQLTALIPVPGPFVCALLEREALTPATPTKKRK
jgi:hypothetical protein